jgi:hypothetical protein
MLRFLDLSALQWVQLLLFGTGLYADPGGDTAAGQIF